MSSRDKKIDKIVGANLRRIRVARGIPQERLGLDLGITFQQIQKYEKGGNSIAAARIPRLCRVLNIAAADLFHGIEMPGQNGAAAPASVPDLDAFAMRLAHQIGKMPRERKLAFARLAETVAKP